MNEQLFAKESMKEAISTIGEAVWTLVYDGNDTKEQITAGRELLQAKWILALICDHVFDYYPASYFLNDEEKKQFPEYVEWFTNHPIVGIANAIKFVEDNFVYLETVTRDKYNQHRIPSRNLEKEKKVKIILNEVSSNIAYFTQKLIGPKKITDPDKPTEAEIQNLIKAISDTQKTYSDYADSNPDGNISLQVFRFNQMLEIYKHPLRAAWQIYKYGSSNDFWEEGDSTIEYVIFCSKAEQVITELTKSLQENSPFSEIEVNSSITMGLLHVYRHLLTQNLKNL